ncbi:MAG: hypothetical protein IPK84_00095 [Candidatus Moraniibacteriota bacterium]|nr:MAG: hypothetical protein IPK84_00095 [Candidatus Moranbacteria bacterium]
MAEEPVTNDELSEEEDVPMKSLGDRAREFRNSLQKRFAEGSALTLVLLFVLGLLFGAAAKAVASRSILIGYWDYTITPKERAAVNLNALQEELAARQKEAAKPQNAEDATASQPEDSGGESVSGQSSSEEELPPLPPTPEPPASPSPEAEKE